jgi:hypothetical protein
MLDPYVERIRRVWHGKRRRGMAIAASAGFLRAGGTEIAGHLSQVDERGAMYVIGRREHMRNVRFGFRRGLGRL